MSDAEMTELLATKTPNQLRAECGSPAIQSSNDALVYVSLDAIGDEREKRDRARGGYLTREAKAE